MWYSKGMNIEKLQFVVKELTGLNLYITRSDNTSMVWSDAVLGEHIRLNIGEIKRIREQHIKRMGGIKNSFLKVIMHEIGHFRHCKSKDEAYQYHEQYSERRKYCERLADRYSRLNYKKVLKALKER